jgi:hypothetical protein
VGAQTEESAPPRPDERSTIALGILADPDLPAVIARNLVDELPEVFARHVSNDVNWRIATVTETRLDQAGSGVEIIDLARKWKLKEGWDLVICLTDLPLRIDGRPVVADASASHGVALISIPALGPAGVQRRVRKTIVRLVDGLMGERLGRDRTDRRRRRRVGRRLVELAGPLEHVSATETGRIRYSAAVIRGNLRLLAGMVRTNRPWRLMTHMSKALAFVAGTAAVTIANSSMWQVSDALGWPRRILLMVVAITVLVTWLIVAHDLWERASDARGREQAVLFNAATVITLLLGVLWLFFLLMAACLIGAVVVIDDSVLEKNLGHPVDLASYGVLAWLVSSLATLGAALGSGLESDETVRVAAYGYHPDEDADDDPGAGDDGDGDDEDENGDGGDGDS